MCSFYIFRLGLCQVPIKSIKPFMSDIVIMMKEKKSEKKKSCLRLELNTQTFKFKAVDSFFSSFSMNTFQ